MFGASAKIISLALACPLLLGPLAGDGARHRRGGAKRRAKMIGTMRGAQTGTWGGEHISLEVTGEGAQIEYDCARGTIDQKIVTDSQGRFDARGTHVREHGGPVRRGEKPDAHPARYSGRIDGDTMTLTVTETDTGEAVGTFTLRHGQQPRVFKCR